jgi:hypothetical protein
MATTYSTEEAARMAAQTGNGASIVNADRRAMGLQASVFTAPVTGAVAVNDIIVLGPADRGLSVIPEMSFCRLSNGSASIAVKLQLKPATGSAVDLTAARTLTNAAVAFAPAAATALAVAGDGACYQLLVTAVTTAAAVDVEVHLTKRRTTGDI